MVSWCFLLFSTVVLNVFGECCFFYQALNQLYTGATLLRTTSLELRWCLSSLCMTAPTLLFHQISRACTSLTHISLIWRRSIDPGSLILRVKRFWANALLQGNLGSSFQENRPRNLCTVLLTQHECEFTFVILACFSFEILSRAVAEVTMRDLPSLSPVELMCLLLLLYSRTGPCQNGWEAPMLADLQYFKHCGYQDLGCW